MSNYNKKESYLEKLSRIIKNRQEVVRKQELEEISKTSQKMALLIHAFFISFFFFDALANPYNNWISLFMCFYLTTALVVIAFKFKERIETPFAKCARNILVITVISLLSAFLCYNSSMGEQFEQEQIAKFFEHNKALVGKDYYNSYLTNKDNLIKLKELRKQVYDDIAI